MSLEDNTSDHVKRNRPWATVRLNVQFPGNPDTYGASVPVRGPESLVGAIDVAKRITVNHMLRDNAARLTEGERAS